ncbi:hypothetical protein J3R82DRAFT_6869 [Butyriboletus roseoflavus]|nr:hypothetical protein J3R82DRAFT_6869 [Butyriboletus roseoflavus]
MPQSSDQDEGNQWAREEQQFMIQEQDRTIDSISGTLTTLAQQAGLMGQEIGQHNDTVLNMACRMLDDLERNVEHSDSKLDSAMRKMKNFIRETEGTWQPVFFDVVIVLTHGLARRHQVGVVHNNFDHYPRHLTCGGHIRLIAWEDTLRHSFFH